MVKLTFPALEPAGVSIENTVIWGAKYNGVGAETFFTAPKALEESAHVNDATVSARESIGGKSTIRTEIIEAC